MTSRPFTSRTPSALRTRVRSTAVPLTCPTISSVAASRAAESGPVGRTVKRNASSVLKRSVVSGHGHVAVGGEITDRQTSIREAGATIRRHEDATVIGTAMIHGRGDALERRFDLDRQRSFTKSDNSANATHRYLS